MCEMNEYWDEMKFSCKFRKLAVEYIDYIKTDYPECHAKECPMPCEYSECKFYRDFKALETVIEDRLNDIQNAMEDRFD